MLLPLPLLLLRLPLPACLPPRCHRLRAGGAAPPSPSTSHPPLSSPSPFATHLHSPRPAQGPGFQHHCFPLQPVRRPGEQPVGRTDEWLMSEAHVACMHGGRQCNGAASAPVLPACSHRQAAAPPCCFPHECRPRAAARRSASMLGVSLASSLTCLTRSRWVCFSVSSSCMQPVRAGGRASRCRQPLQPPAAPVPPTNLCMAWRAASTVISCRHLAHSAIVLGRPSP